MGDGRAPVVRMRAQSAELLGHPVAIMVQPETVSYLGESGELLAADTVAFSVREAGGQTMTLPPDFSGGAAAGWTASLDTGTDDFTVSFPGGIQLYGGTMPTTPGWVEKVRPAGSLVVLTGPMASLNDFEPLLTAGRILWVRVPLSLT